MATYTRPDGSTYEYPSATAYPDGYPRPENPYSPPNPAQTLYEESQEQVSALETQLADAQTALADQTAASEAAAAAQQVSFDEQLAGASSPSAKAQEIAETQGVAYQDIATKADSGDVDFASYDAGKVGQALADNTTFQPGTSYVDQAKSTVAGQLETLLDSESPYIKQAKQQAIEQASGRGLLNTTLAAQAGQRAAIQSALPIAQQDAQTFATAQSQQQAAEYAQQTMMGEGIVSGELVEQKAGIERKNQDINNAFTALMTGVDAQNATWMADLQYNYNTGLQELQQAHEQQMLTLELNQRQAQAVADNAASIMQNYQVSVENLLSDPDFLELGADAVNNAVQQLQNLAANSIGFIGASQGVDMDVFIDAYLEPTVVL